MVTCPRCHEQVDGIPGGCRDLACPTLEIEELEREQYDGIMANAKAESAGNVAYNAAIEVVIAAARDVVRVWRITPLANAMFEPMRRLNDALERISDSLDKTP